MNIVFLDIDYVLNSYRKSKEIYELTGKRHSGKDFPFDEECMDNLKYIISETDAYIGSKPASTSAESILEKQKTLSNKLGLFSPVLFNNSEMK